MSALYVLDRRQDRTRKAIRNAFIELIFEKDFQSVSMAAVADRANIGRSTLYEHFRTKNDLLRDNLTTPMSALASIVGSRDVPAHLCGWLRHFREKQALGRVLFFLPTRDTVLSVLTGLIERRLAEVAAQPSCLPLNLVAAQIAAAQFAMLTPWILGQVALPVTALATALHRSTKALTDTITGHPGNS
ncbi:TetR/AcrR family transcriptional regulator [Asticcacaulis benevestitus]|uniref:HTH tetR-type domain-containing protein n=1 Tax=Asticcacaulis benevestitus DSM 16100 = ATCC BAA-896 TaxID=1121022 RepID=V4RTN1_9CAUL|nr:helix-turn-helix domain-containing protein [Asticcacaulis benevestitus]ESQ94523.1 hypothetical protein ABENE_00080 [Asticcacaulis benevestitus DSM 16100 = ATCC BAA-896]